MPTHHEGQVNQAVVRRLAKIEGHVRSVNRMVQEQRDCSDILVQLAAVQSAVTQVGKLVLTDHVESCVSEAADSGEREQVLQKLLDALQKFIR